MPVDKAAVLAGTNPDYGIQDLYNAIASGNPVGPLLLHVTVHLL